MDLQLADSTELSHRESITELEDYCKHGDLEADGMKKIVVEITNYHAAGVYAREMLAPKGATLVGEIHLKDQINIISQGSIRVKTEQGTRVVTAPCTFISPAGTKRAGYVLEDVIWTVFHATDSEDQEEIKNEFIAPDYNELDKKLEHKDIRRIA